MNKTNTAPAVPAVPGVPSHTIPDTSSLTHGNAGFLRPPLSPLLCVLSFLKATRRKKTLTPPRTCFFQPACCGEGGGRGFRDRGGARGPRGHRGLTRSPRAGCSASSSTTRSPPPFPPARPKHTFSRTRDTELLQLDQKIELFASLCSFQNTRKKVRTVEADMAKARRREREVSAGVEARRRGAAPPTPAPKCSPASSPRQSRAPPPPPPAPPPAQPPRNPSWSRTLAPCACS